jgi:dTDP-D-glucose 4,6-dehydratase
LTNSKSSIKYLPPRPDDPVRRCPDISKAKQTLKWFPKTELNEGLIKTIYWIKENAR